MFGFGTFSEQKLRLIIIWTLLCEATPQSVTIVWNEYNNHNSDTRLEQRTYARGGEQSP